ncbi:AAA family ATPase [Methanocalculus sp.]|uniref:AAA family ATPase n=1 Tax=Methanocalculus sp. TaxID=2004547 RepID=UPI00260614E7|nr:AAA family ATPase [Methanocalculus sp.]MDG6250056.1 AAA family ATPase [Methanocalculus sp.]
MYLSKLRIQNYRSIDELDIIFEKGKNVIIGRNNSGKSNILKAIDIVLGESFPAYHKTQNIAENDFYKGNTDKPIYIYCELRCDRDEELNYEEMYKNCYGFFLHGNYQNSQYDHEYGVKYITGKANQHIIQDPMFWHDIEKIISINKDDPEVHSYYINGKARSYKPYEEEFREKEYFAFAFKATLEQDKKIKKEIRFLYRENENSKWYLSFTAPIRTEFLQSAIIPAFRDPSQQLRIANYTWYGKLLRHFSAQKYDELKNAFKAVKDVAHEVFSPLVKDINDKHTCIAFPETSISFECAPDSKDDIHKNVMIYVDDGFNSLLNDKGAGIQSAVIIGLFNYYTRYISHSGSSLLGIEEPELYLHPHGRRVISYRLDDFVDGGKNQVILTTHSSEFITSAHENVNLVVVKNDKELGTTAVNTRFDNPKEKQILVKIENSEMFFADKVILVEGGEKYILESLAKHYGTIIKPDLGENWLNDCNISIIAVSGKTEFWKYAKKLNELAIDNYIAADFDFLFNGLNAFVNEIDADPKVKEGVDKLKNIIGYQNEDNKKNIDDIENPINREHVSSVIHWIKRFKFTNTRLYVLRGDLEYYYKTKAREQFNGIKGKEMRPIYLVSNLIDEETTIIDLIESDDYFGLFEMILSSDPETEEVKHCELNQKKNCQRFNGDG